MANVNTILREAGVSQVSWEDARACWWQFRLDNGYKTYQPLSIVTDPDKGKDEANNLKLAKDRSVVTLSLSLAQADSCVHSHIWQVLNLPRITFCPFSTLGCRQACVAKNGNGAYPRTLEARALRNAFLLVHPSQFASLWAHEIDEAYLEYGDRLRVRGNTFADLRWEEICPWLFTGPRAMVQFYDYSKDWGRNPPANYHLTFSVSERHSDRTARSMVADGNSVAVVFTTKKDAPLPELWHGIRVIDGDHSDNRADDPATVVVGLRAKGRMRKDETGMVRVAS